VSPSGADSGTAANPDGSTLKVPAPVLVSPADGERVDSVRPSVVFANVQGRFANSTFSYRIQVLDAAGAVIGEFSVPQDSGGNTTFAAATDQPYDTEFRWRVRAELEGQAGPWSALWSFRTPQRVLLGDAAGPVGPPRDMSFNEAFDILYEIYTAGRWDLTGRSNRTQLNLYLETAMAAVHYGHGKWNPRGGDPNWCIKNGGPGRPQSDDVIARCDTRDAWDLVGGIGGPNPFWAPSYIGRLPSIQQVYPPNPETLRLLP
jgi:hypothetical protein